MKHDVVAEIWRLSERRKAEWGKNDALNPDEDFENFLTGLEGVAEVEVVITLLKTFDDSFDDGGTQDVVCSVLNTVPIEILDSALRVELPQLTERAPEWVDVIISDRKRRENFTS